MSKIVCATRGGEGSRAAQMAAIRAARETEQPLVFLYVTDPTTLAGVAESLQSAVRDELHWMGQTLLQIARQRAVDARLHSEIVIRHGAVREEIIRYLQEADASRLFLGAPRGTTANVFGDDAIEQFAQQVMQQTSVDVTIVRPEGQATEIKGAPAGA